MANRRMINSDLFSDDVFMELDDVTRLVWIGLIVMSADDQGRLQDNEALIKSQIFPMDNKAPAKIKSSLDVLEKHSMIHRYQEGDKKLIQIVNWWKHQTPSWASASNYPAPKSWVDREKYHSVGNKVVTTNWDTLGGFSDLHSDLHSALPTGVSRLIDDGDVKSDVNGEVKCEPELLKKPASASAFFEPLKLFKLVTGMNAIPASEIQKALPALETLWYQHDKDDDKLTSYLKPYFENWTKRRGKNGAFYSKANCSWLYDWAIAGEIPANGNGAHKSTNQGLEAVKAMAGEEGITLDGIFSEVSNG